MTQPELAAAAGLSKSTIIDFELERRDVSPDAVERIKTSLEAAGVAFVDPNGMGEGVRRRQNEGRR